MSHHMDNMGGDGLESVLGQQCFLLWHGVHLCEFELELHNVGAEITVSYGEGFTAVGWAVVGRLHHVRLTVTIPGPGGVVVAGVLVTVGVALALAVVGAVDPGQPTLADGQQVIDHTTVAIGRESVYDPVWVGGRGCMMSLLGCVPADLIFWLRCATVDCLWWRWQQSPRGQGHDITRHGLAISWIPGDLLRPHSSRRNLQVCVRLGRELTRPWRRESYDFPPLVTVPVGHFGESEANLFHLGGHQLHGTYSRAGTPQFIYQDGIGSVRFFRGKNRIVSDRAGGGLCRDGRCGVDHVQCSPVNIEPLGVVSPVHTGDVTAVHRFSVVPHSIQGRLDTDAAGGRTGLCSSHNGLGNHSVARLVYLSE
jgi:hypothetical protein